jgi:hypothetical protein
MKTDPNRTAVNRAKVIPIHGTSSEAQSEAEQYSPLTRVLLAVILTILFLAFMATDPPGNGAPAPCPPPHPGRWPQDCP